MLRVDCSTNSLYLVLERITIAHNYVVYLSEGDITGEYFTNIVVAITLERITMKEACLGPKWHLKTFSAILCSYGLLIGLMIPSSFDCIPMYNNLLLSVPLLYHSMGQIIKSVFLSVYVCMYVCVCVWARLRSHFSTDLHEIW